MLRLIQQMYQYDDWAMDRLLVSLRQLSAEEYATVPASGHGSICNTYAHLLAVQWRWFSWFSGRLSAEQALLEQIEPQQVATLEQAASRWQAVREQTERTIQGLSQEAVVSEWPLGVPNAPLPSLPLWKMLMHVANHGTHTRAQIMAAIRLSGHVPQGADLIHMLLGR